MCKQWLGNETLCDLCRENLRKGLHFYDAVVRTPKMTRALWALVCESCYRKYRSYSTLGTGKGQQYDSITNLKTDG